MRSSLLHSWSKPRRKNRRRVKMRLLARTGRTSSEMRGWTKPELVRALEAVGVAFRAVTGTNEILLSCPLCFKENHFYINVIKRVGYCQRCKEAMNYRRLCTVFRLPATNGHGFMSQAPSMNELKALHESIFGRVKEAYKPDDFPTCELPMGILPAWRVPHAIKYLYQRGIPMRDIQRFDLKYAAYGPYMGRVLFPLWWNDQLVGFQARSIRDMKPKYVFPKGIPASKILYPQQNLEIGRCVITEGVIPAILYQGLATFGKRLSEDQLRVLMRAKHILLIILAWDGDAWYSESPAQDAPALETWERL